MKIIETKSVNDIYNIAGSFEQKNIDTIKAILKEYDIKEDDYEKHIDFSLSRPGQDCRYALDDTKLQNIGWQPIKNFNDEIKNITAYYKQRFIW
jgi:dTDP-D-glucose 4,6-dehydratase